MDFKKWDKIFGWVIFAITFLVYFLTAQRTISFWDSPEFISAAYKLQVSHPPGAPLYLMLLRIFMSVFPQSSIAFAGSLFSVIGASFTVMLLYLCITHVARKIIGKADEINKGEAVAIIASGVVGALSMVFAHSYWAASTEAEVYTVSSLLVAFTFWFALKWEAEKEYVKAIRWLLLITFLFGLSAGVHIMNFAMTFPLAMLFIFKKFGFNWKTAGLSLVSGLLLFFLLKNGLFTGFMGFAAKLDLLLVNSYGLPFNSGLVLAYVLLVLLLVFGLYYTHRRKKYLAHHIILGIGLFMIGWSTYNMVLVRSSAQLPVSSNASNPKQLKSYVQAEQFDFGQRKLVKGPSFNAPLDKKKPFVDGEKVYSADEKQGRYVLTNDGKYMIANYDKRFDLWFPRISDKKSINIQGYYNWVDIKGEPISYTNSIGKTETIYKPTFGENLTYFFKFQLGYLNLRYLMWNFAGTQNRSSASGDPLGGNWMSGIDFLDFGRVGNTSLISKRNMALKDRNNFYLLPLILGLFGLVFLFLRDRKMATVTLIFYLAFSVAITIFINQQPIHISIRDRDYIFLLAYFTFCIWIGLGVLGLFKLIPKLKENTTKAYLVGGLTFLAVPLQMGAKGWDDHDRSRDKFVYKLAKAYLDACDKDALLITVGDNATFPIWYLQEVEGYRTDVRVINYELLNIDHYINKLRRKINDSKPVKMSLPENAYVEGVDKLLPLIDKLEDGVYAPVGQVVDFASSENKQLWNGRNINYFPASRFSLKADTAKLRVKGINPEEHWCHFIPAINWEFKKNFYSIADLVLLDILQSNNWERPICFTNLDYYNHFIGLNKHCLIKGVVNELLPIAPVLEKNNNRMYDVGALSAALMQDGNGGVMDLGDPTEYYSYECRDIARSTFRPAFFYLSDAYLERNNPKSAKEVLEKCTDLIPDTVVQYRKYMFDVGKMYYKVGQPERAKEVISTMVDNLFAETHHFLSFSPSNKLITRKRSTINIEIIAIVAKEVKQYDRDLSLIIQSKLDMLNREMQTWTKQNFE